MIVAHLFLQFLKTRLGHRADFIADLIATVISSVFALMFVLVLFVPIDDLAGWKRDEILFIYGLSLIPYGIFAMFSWNLYDFGSKYIVDGAFDRVLLRPVNSFLQVLCESFRVHALAESLLGVFVMGHAATRLGIDLGVADLVWIAITVVSGTTIFLSVFGILAAFSFFAEDRVGIAPPIFNLINPSRYPPDLYGPVVRGLLRFVIPFHFVAFFPASRLLRPGGFQPLAASAPIAACCCALMLAFVWTFGSRRYTSTGS